MSHRLSKPHEAPALRPRREALPVARRSAAKHDTSSCGDGGSARRSLIQEALADRKR